MCITLVHPSTCLIVGPTGSGKTIFVQRMLREAMFDPAPERIIWVYSEWQPAYEQFRQFIEFRKDIDEDLYESLSPETRNLIVLDDQMSRIGDSTVLSRLFTEGSHHRNLSIVYIVQNLFDKGRSHRTVSLNAQYIVLFKNPRDASQVEILARQMFPKQSSYLVDAYKDATREPYGYLFLDLRPETPEEFRVRASIFPNDKCIVYTPHYYKSKK